MNHSIISLLEKVSILERIKYSAYVKNTSQIAEVLLTKGEIIPMTSSDTNCLCYLQIFVLSKVLYLLGHQDLISLATAFPQLIEEVSRAMYWTDIEVYFDKSVFTKEQFYLLAYHLGSVLDSFRFNARLCCGKEEILEKFTNLKKLQIFKIPYDCYVTIICKQMVYLKDISLEFKSLNDDHIDLIRFSLKYLHSFSFCSDNIVNRGVYDLITNIKTLRKFGLKSSTISVELIETLINLHHRSIIEIYISSKDVLMKDKAFDNIAKCINIRRLLLSNVKFSQPYGNFIGRLNYLEDFMIGYHEFTSKEEHLFDKSLLSKPKYTLKKLALCGLRTSYEFFKNIIYNFPNLSILVVDATIYYDDPKIFYELYQKIEKVHLFRVDYGTAVMLLWPLKDENFLKKDYKLKEFFIDLMSINEQKAKELFVKNIQEMKRTFSYRFNFNYTIDNSHSSKSVFLWSRCDEDYENNIFQVNPL